MIRFLRFLKAAFYTIAIAAAFVLVGWLVASVFVQPAGATDIDWFPRSTPHYGHAHHVRRHRHVEHGETIVRLYRSMDDREFHCGGQVRGLGTQWIGTEGAMDAAKKDWMERVRYDLGESFLDLTNAKDFISRCGRTSIGEAMGQVMYRCEIVARPCKAPFTDGDAAKKD